MVIRDRIKDADSELEFWTFRKILGSGWCPVKGYRIHDPFKLEAQIRIKMCIRALPYLPYKAVLWIRIDILVVDSERIRIQVAVSSQ
jgi:hypothetical protein